MSYIRTFVIVCVIFINYFSSCETSNNSTAKYSTLPPWLVTKAVPTPAAETICADDNTSIYTLISNRGGGIQNLNNYNYPLKMAGNNPKSRNGKTNCISPEIEQPLKLKIAESAAAAPDLEWISKPLREGLAEFRVKSEINEICNLHVDLYDAHLKSNTLWAVRMAGSSQSELIGLLSGTTYQMGNFEECINTNSFTYDIRGKYCLANFRYGYTAESAIAEEPLQKNSSLQRSMSSYDELGDINQDTPVWEGLFRLNGDPARINRQELYWSFCIPESCTSDDLAASLNHTLLPRFEEYNLQLHITVDPIYCTVTGDFRSWFPFTVGFWITIIFVVSLITVIMISTLRDAVDYFQRRRRQEQNYESGADNGASPNVKVASFWKELIGVISIWRNTRSLLVSSNKGSQVKIIDCMKVLLMVVIIYVHLMLFAFGYPQFSPEYAEKRYHGGIYAIFSNNAIVVNAFLMISGFLTFYYGYAPMKKGGVVYLVQKIIFRYFRLMPVLAIGIGYVIFILPYADDGPIWKAKIMVERENCRKNWWLSLLLLNNVINVEEQCLGIGWYITTDILLCTLATLLMYIMSKSRKFGLYLSSFVLVLSVVTTFWVTYTNRFNGILKNYMGSLVDPRKNVEYGGLYVTLHSRVAPYLVGFYTGYLCIKLQEKKFTFSTRSLLVGTIFFTAISAGSFIYGSIFYWPDRPYYPLENALYASLHSIFFVLIHAWLILAYVTTGFGTENVLSWIMNHHFFTVLARISYSVFLVHMTVLLCVAASMRTPIYYSKQILLIYLIGSTVITYGIAIPFYLFIEAPICGVSKLLEKSFESFFHGKELGTAETNLNNNKNGDIKL